MAMNYQQQFPHPRAASAINSAILATFPTTKSKFPATPAAPALISQQQQQHPAMSINPAQLMAINPASLQHQAAHMQILQQSMPPMAQQQQAMMGMSGMNMNMYPQGPSAMMLPPRGNMNMNMNMGMMSGMHAPMCPPSCAMSFTPVNGVHGMFPSTSMAPNSLPYQTPTRPQQLPQTPHLQQQHPCSTPTPIPVLTASLLILASPYLAPNANWLLQTCP
ncbi:hypothetical protein C0995_012702 [Termitomyces sp. Mi166|nr:hypothetical protein C0995_012702 [Termitomyces sp. Mi166\